jgi:hypothetical protein
MHWLPGRSHIRKVWEREGAVTNSAYGGRVVVFKQNNNAVDYGWGGL